MTSWEPYRVITDSEALLEMFIDRIEDMDVSRITVDEAGGFTPGYSAKLLCQPPMKHLVTESFTRMLKATGIVLIAVVDDDRFADTKSLLSKRKKRVRPVARIKRVRGFFTKETGRKFGKKRWDGITPEIRKKMMRKVAKARWRRRHRGGASLISANPASSGHDHTPPAPSIPESQALVDQASPAAHNGQGGQAIPPNGRPAPRGAHQVAG